MMSVLRSFFAVVVGYMVMMITVIVLTLIFVKTMGLKTGHPTPGYLFINVVYTFLAAAIGGYVTARIAEFKPIQAAFVLAGLMLAMGVVSYRHYSGLQPTWYQIMMQIAPPLCALAGAAVYARNAPAITG
jgi:hypothetical protein